MPVKIRVIFFGLLLALAAVAAWPQSNVFWSQGGTWASPFKGTTTAIGGALLLAGACTAATTVTVAGVTVGMAVFVSPATGTDPGDGTYPKAFVSAANTISVKICSSALISLTPTSTTYNVVAF